MTPNESEKDDDTSFRPASYDGADCLEEDLIPSTEQVFEGILGEGLLEGEIEIARIVLEATVQEFVLILARSHESGWHYRMVDEYETQFELSYTESPLPLTLEDLIELIDTASSEVGIGYVRPVLILNSDCDDVEELRDFITVSSRFYPGLGSYYQNDIDQWIRANRFGAKVLHPGFSDFLQDNPSDLQTETLELQTETLEPQAETLEPQTDINKTLVLYKESSALTVRERLALTVKNHFSVSRETKWTAWLQRIRSWFFHRRSDSLGS